MSNKTRLQDNNTALQSLIDKANSLPDAGSGGGSSSGNSADVCSLFVDFSANVNSAGISYVSFENGEFDGGLIQLTSNNSTITINNVVVGSVIRVSYRGYNLPGFTLVGMELKDYISTMDRAYKITANANETASITVYNAD